MKSFVAVVVNHDDANYFLVSNGRVIIVPRKVMHQRCEFFGLTDAKGIIKNGARLNLVEVNTDRGVVYYPNHKFYLNNKREEEPRLRLIPCSFSITPFSYGVESEYLEFKESFSCMTGIKETLVAFANCGHEGTVLVGVADDGIPKGLRYLTKNEQKNLIDDFRNQIKIECNNLEFAQSIQINWEVQCNKTICRIVVPAWNGDLLFLHKDKLYVRMRSTNQLLKGADLVHFIESRCQKSM